MDPNECVYVCASIFWALFWLIVGFILGYTVRTIREGRIPR